MTTTSVHDLALPLHEFIEIERQTRLDMLAEARVEHWLVRTPLGFALTRYEDVVAILRERRFHSALSLIPQMQGVDRPDFETRRPSILSMEGDEHARLRRLVAPAFTPMAAEHLRPFMREVVAELVDAVSPAGRCDFVEAISDPYPIPIICELLGAPKQDWRLFSDWATDIFKIFNMTLAEDFPAIERASGELEAYIRALVERHREGRDDAKPSDLLGTLIAVEEAGDRLSSDELIMLAEAVLMAGTDTTRNQLACCIALLGAHPDQWKVFVDRPELAPRVVEETMRYLGAVQGTLRVASTEITYRDVMFPQGTLVSIPLAAANRDPAIYGEPDRFDVTRETSVPHMSFGSGIHHCLGAHLARAELQEALVVIAQRWPDLALDGPVEWKPEQFGIWGPARLPVRWDTSTG